MKYNRYCYSRAKHWVGCLKLSVIRTHFNWFVSGLKQLGWLIGKDHSNWLQSSKRRTTTPTTSKPAATTSSPISAVSSPTSGGQVTP